MGQSQESGQLNRLFCSNHCCLELVSRGFPLLPFWLLLLWFWAPGHSCLFPRSCLRYIINTVENQSSLQTPCYSSSGAAQQGFKPIHSNCVAIRAGLPCKAMILDISSPCLQKNARCVLTHTQSHTFTNLHTIPAVSKAPIRTPNIIYLTNTDPDSVWTETVLGTSQGL